MINRFPIYGFVISLIFVFASCGSGNSFYKSKSGRVKKVRTGESDSKEVVAEEDAPVIYYEPNEEETILESHEEMGIESDNLEVDIEESVLEVDTLETENVILSLAETIQKQKAENTRAFNDNHYAQLGLFLGGLLFSAIGYVYWNAIPYVIGFVLFCGAFVLSLLMKYKIAKEQKDTEDRKYKNRMWLTNFVFYGSMLVILLTLIAFLVILV